MPDTAAIQRRGRREPEETVDLFDRDVIEIRFYKLLDRLSRKFASG